MGECIKDHSVDDILEKIEDVQDELSLESLEQLKKGMEAQKWDQLQLNAIFHSLKKLQKKLDAEEKEKLIRSLENFLK